MEWFGDDAYWLSRLVFQRALAVVYLIAFVSAALQFRALIGSRGMLPVPEYLRRVPARRAPTLFRLHWSDRFFASVAWAGALLSAALAAGAADHLPLGVAMAWWAAGPRGRRRCAHPRPVTPLLNPWSVRAVPI
ncbi:hypothetical protein ACWDPI_34490, partial [Streptomyces zhihengii]